VSSVLKAQGWMNPEIIAEETRSDGVMGLFGGKGDPFFCCYCYEIKLAIAQQQILTDRPLTIRRS
jgi:hypothetical protein